MYSNGNIKLYISYFQYIGPKYFVSSKCFNVPVEAILRETASLQQNFQNLLAYTSYSLQIAAQNEYGVGHYSRPLVVETAPWSMFLIKNKNRINIYTIFSFRTP